MKMTRAASRSDAHHGTKTTPYISGSIAWLLAVALAIAGCSTSEEKTAQPEAEVSDASVQSMPDEGEDEDATIITGAEEGASIQGATEGAVWTGAPMDDPDSPLYVKVIYFEFDSSEVDLKYHETLAAHADYLATNPVARVRLEGNCDERGSREYNIALGERRGVAVKRLLIAGGAQEDQIEVISYGEERPAASGQGEESWNRNRRVDIVYEAGGQDY